MKKVNVVFSCASSKRFPITLYSRNYNKEDWSQAILNRGPRYKVKDLYKGSYWEEVLKVYEKYKNKHNFYVLSAGLGLVSFEDTAPSYNASFSRRALDTVPIGWVNLQQMQGIISTSNEYLQAAKIIGLTSIKPSGRKWLGYFGGTGFNLSPKLIDLYLSGENLQEIYNGLPEAKPQILPKARPKITPDKLKDFYRKGMSATHLRRLVNNAGFGLSVQRAFDYIKANNSTNVQKGYQ